MSDDTGTKSDGAGKKIELENVSQVFPGRLGTRIRAVDNVSFDLSNEPPKIISLVGASGSGKSTIARIILGLQRPTGGSVRYGGKNIFRLSRRERDTFRRDVQPVFQDPYSIFNPFYRVDRIFFKAIKKFKLVKSKTDAITMIERSLSVVQLTPSEVLGRYAHQLSGGQRQRLMLARLHMLQPSYVIADEPVSMLDAQVRKNFLDVLVRFNADFGMTTLFITHDLSTVAYVGGEMKTLFHGRVVEEGPVSKVLTEPSHDYTRLLLASVPEPDPDRRWTDRIDLVNGVPRLVETGERVPAPEDTTA